MKKRERGFVGPAIRRVNNLMACNLEAHVKARGIDEMTVVHGWFLKYLYNNRDKDIYQKDIEKQFCVGRSSVTNTIQLMEKKGYVRREAVEQDARLKKVVLTEHGMELQLMMESLIEEMNEKTLHGITDDELESFFRVIDKLEANLIRQKEERQQGKE